MELDQPTFVGQVASVTGAIVRVRLRDDMPSTLVLIEGESYRVGQVGAFFRIPLGYANLYAVCTQVGADAAPSSGGGEQVADLALEMETVRRMDGFRWMTVVLFGEGVGQTFERGVGRYPTVGDEVHLVTNADLKLVYRGSASSGSGSLPVGQIAASSGIPAEVNVAGLVSRHSVVVGSTGSGKSNLITVLLETVADGNLPSARTIVIDPHGEYAACLGDRARVFRVRSDVANGEFELQVPFWALPFDELQDLLLGGLQPNHEAAIRDEVLALKLASLPRLSEPPPEEMITADSPIPFSIKRLWFELDSFERVTFPVPNPQTDENANHPEEVGDIETLRARRYPAASAYNAAPYKNQRKRNIERQLDLMKSRLKDGRFSFLFAPGDGLNPNVDGAIQSDLDVLVRSWVGHDTPITIFDVSEIPAEVQPMIVGTLLRVVYEMLYWGQGLAVGGREQPLLVVIDEAHRFIPDGGKTPAHRTLSMIAKEGRKYGVGLMLVTQRPSELDAGILSQCGSIVALRTTNAADRSRIAAAAPDDLGGIVELLPALRTGEAVFLGEVMPLPSRVRIRRATTNSGGGDPALPAAWERQPRPDGSLYSMALVAWRRQTVAYPSTD